jgi:uncharacterized protein YggT (Ycf19 family)
MQTTSQASGATVARGEVKLEAPVPAGRGRTPLRSRGAIGGFLMIAMAAVALFLNRGLAVGSIADMGPGFMPMLVSLLLLLAGAAIVMRAVIGAEPAILSAEVAAAPWRGIAAVSIGIVLFAVLLQPAGLVLAVAVLTLVSMLANPHFKPLEAVIYSIALAALAAIIFVYALKVPLALWPTF